MKKFCTEINETDILTKDQHNEAFMAWVNEHVSPDSVLLIPARHYEERFTQECIPFNALAIKTLIAETSVALKDIGKTIIINGLSIYKVFDEAHQSVRKILTNPLFHKEEEAIGKISNIYTAAIEDKNIPEHLKVSIRNLTNLARQCLGAILINSAKYHEKNRIAINKTLRQAGEIGAPREEYSILKSMIKGEK